MPQGRRKTPFSGKAKKEQLKTKKQSKHLVTEGSTSKSSPSDNTEVPQRSQDFLTESTKLNYQCSKTTAANLNRYALQFKKESDAEIKQRKERAFETLKNAPETELEVDPDQYYDSELDFPKRPPWSFDERRELLEMKENKYFSEYLKTIESNFNLKELGYFELNLETWRQFWRVLEMSDVILLIVDIRYAPLQFPPSLYHYVTDALKKDMILVLNKIDIAPPPLVAAWKSYFHEKYPSLHIALFSSFASTWAERQKSGKKKLPRKPYGNRKATQLLYEICRNIVKNCVDLSSWDDKLRDEAMDTANEDDLVIAQTELVNLDTSYVEHQKFKNQILTMGCVGYPNVGKSSVINALMGKKVVSVSKTPGHTKHFQTIFITSNVKLCDCPGLVFPSKVPQPLQVLMGSYPIAQLREPYSAVKYLAEHSDLIQLLGIQHPEGDDCWCAMDICDGWAKKRGFFTAKAARPDSYRAANHLLRMALDGKICLFLRPLLYSERKDEMVNHPDVQQIQAVQGVRDEQQTNLISGSESEDSDNTDDVPTPVCAIANKFSPLEYTE